MGWGFPLWWWCLHNIVEVLSVAKGKLYVMYISPQWKKSIQFKIFFFFCAKESSHFQRMFFINIEKQTTLFKDQSLKWKISKMIKTHSFTWYYIQCQRAWYKMDFKKSNYFVYWQTVLWYIWNSYVECYRRYFCLTSSDEQDKAYTPSLYLCLS